MHQQIKVTPSIRLTFFAFHNLYQNHYKYDCFNVCVYNIDFGV